MTLTVILSGTLMALMAAAEILHFRRCRRLTFLTAAHALIAVGYCLPAFILSFAPGTRLETGLWHGRLYVLDLADRLALPPGSYLTVMIILFGAYAAMVAGYAAGRKIDLRPLGQDGIPAPWLAALGGFLGFVAVAAFAVYAAQFNGLSDFLASGWAIRAGYRPVRLGFLQILVQLGLPVFILLVAAALRTRGLPRAILAASAALVWAVVLARLVHVSGRLELGAFILFPLLAWAFLTVSRARATTRIAVAGLIGLIGLFLASAPYALFSEPAKVLVTMAGTFIPNFDKAILFVLKDFAFPHIAAAHTLTVVPGIIDFRWFIDIPLGVAYMLPNFSGVETLPPMILSLHVKLLPWIPVDLVSFGYYSLGTLGVLIAFAAFGALLALFDGWLTQSAGWLGQALRAAWLFYLPFRLFYADPYAALQSGFGLIAGTVFILALALLARRRTGTRAGSPPPGT